MVALWNAITTVAHPDEDSRRRGRVLIVLTGVLMIVALLAVPLFFILNPTFNGIKIILALLLGLTITLVLARQGFVTIAGIVMTILLLLVPTVALMMPGRVNAEPVYFLLAPLIAGVIFRPWQTWIVTGVTIAVMFAVLFSLPESPFENNRSSALIRNTLIVLGVVTFTGWLSSINTRSALHEAQGARSELEGVLKELEHNNLQLEARVAERTTSLAAAVTSLEEREASLARIIAENDQQRATILEMSVPVIPVSQSTLVMPLVGALDTARLQQLQFQALKSIEQSKIRTLVLDITGVVVVDSQVAQGLIRVVEAARLLGVTTLLVGIRPEVAQAIVGLGLNFQNISTYSDLQAALRSGI